MSRATSMVWAAALALGSGAGIGLGILLEHALK
jgi:hypothetical protein